MSRSQIRRVLQYVKSGSVSKLRRFVRQHDIDLDKIRDSEDRSLLHLACYLGDGRTTRFLLRHGVDAHQTDSHGNTPLHTALEYSLEFNNETAFVELVLPLKRKSKRVMNLKNNMGRTPTQLFEELKSALRKSLLLREAEDSDSCSNDEHAKKCERMNFSGNCEMKPNNKGMKSEMSKERNVGDEEREWEEKLAFENSCEDFYFKEEYHLPEEETYSHWADRIRHEYYAKRTSKQPKKHEREESKEEKTYEKLTKRLVSEHEEYIERMRSKTKSLRLVKQREDYEQLCKDTFDAQNTKLLAFSDIPWPCGGSAVDMVEKLREFAIGEDTVKYLKVQRIRWHPDRFLQRCQHRLKEKNKKQILDLVKEISQGINALITSL